eukprot:103701_1
MAEKIRSILLNKYRANSVDVSQKIDKNSYGNSDINNNANNWSWIVNNSTLFILCFIALCGTIIVGFQKKFPFKYQNVYSKLSSFNNKNNNNNNNNNFDSISIDKYNNNNNDTNLEKENDKLQETELNVNVNSA